MGQKVNPHGLRVGVIKDWDSRWFARDNAFGDILVEDYNLRKFLKKKLYDAGVPKIEIEKLRAECEALVNKGKTQKLTVLPLGVIEVKSPDKNAQLVAENIAAQLEGRVSFRRAMKQAIGRAMKPMGREPGAKGIKTQCSGRLGGAEIARVEQYHEGTIPLQTLRADIDYGFAEAATTYGRIGVKVWIYAGEVLQDRKPKKEGGRK